jgi:hypothetical protein
MAIVHLGSWADRTKQDAVIVSKAGRVRRSYDNNFTTVTEIEEEGPFIDYVTYTSHVGLCLSEREMNGYDDSDFYMLVWNEEKNAPEEILFASTRGWTYPCYASSVDATPDVKIKYEAYKKTRYEAAVKAERHNRAVKKAEFRKFAHDAAKAYGFKAYRLYKLKKADIPSDQFERICALIRPNSKIRNTFKLDMRNNLVNWLATDKPKYALPFSYKQFQYI